MNLLNEAILVLALAVFAGAMVIGAASDLYRYEIPNEVSIAIVVAFVPAAFAGGLGLLDIAVALAVGFGCMIIGIGLFVINLFGGGDVKLLSAGAVWAGWEALPSYLFVVGLVVMYWRCATREATPTYWLRLFVVGTVASGVVWGSCLLTLIPSGSIFHEGLTALWLCGLAAGSVAADSVAEDPSPSAFMAVSGSVF